MTAYTKDVYRVFLPLTFVLTLLGGCTNLSGIGGSAEYACKAPDGVRCESVSGNYYNALKNNLPSQRPVVRGGSGERAEAFSQVASPLLVSQRATRDPGDSIRAEARIMRMWYKAWEDSDHDLYDQGYVYVQVDEGRWLLDHARHSRDKIMAVRPPRRTSASASSTKETTPARPDDDVHSSLEQSFAKVARALPGKAPAQPTEAVDQD